MQDIPCLAAAVPLGEGNCHSHVVLVGTEGSASRTGVKMLSFPPTNLQSCTQRQQEVKNCLSHPKGTHMDTPTHPSWAPPASQGSPGHCWCSNDGWHKTLHAGSCGMGLDSNTEEATGELGHPLQTCPASGFAFTRTPDSCVINLLCAFIWWPIFTSTTILPLPQLAAHASKELFLLFGNHIAHFHRWRKARQIFCTARGFRADGEKHRPSSRWVTSPPESKGGVGGHGMAGLTKDLCASPFLDGPWSFWLRHPEISSALPQRFWRSGNVFSFRCGKRTKLLNFPEMFFVVVVIVAIETSGFRLRRLGFLFGFFSAYKLTPENLNTFPWKCY